MDDAYADANEIGAVLIGTSTLRLAVVSCARAAPESMSPDVASSDKRARRNSDLIELVILIPQWMWIDSS